MNLPDEQLLGFASADIVDSCSHNCYPLKLVEIHCHVWYGGVELFDLKIKTNIFIVDGITILWLMYLKK